WQWQSDMLMRSNARLDVPPGRYRITAVNQQGKRIFEQTLPVTSGSLHSVHIVPQAKRQISEQVGPDVSNAGHEPRSIGLAPDGRWLAGGPKSDKRLRPTTDPASTAPVGIMSEAVGPIACSHDGKWVASVLQGSAAADITNSSTSSDDEPARALKFIGKH